ncbi:hypothetical protein CJG67_001244 [Salmonella enterica subsp. enterica serovar Gaminara]|nr:hypothetical protein [Salmonella enterica subsp. enterica serovar Gaminara]
MKTLTHEQYLALLYSQNVERQDYAVICPMCGTVQSARLLIQAGVAPDFGEAVRYLGFSCVGRFTGKSSPSDEKGKNHGCNWTLGGLLQCHVMVPEDPTGVKRPVFEPATPEQARKQAARMGVIYE